MHICCGFRSPQGESGLPKASWDRARPTTTLGDTANADDMGDSTAAKATIAPVHPLRIYSASILSTSAVLFSVHGAPATARCSPSAGRGRARPAIVLPVPAAAREGRARTVARTGARIEAAEEARTQPGLTARVALSGRIHRGRLRRYDPQCPLRPPARIREHHRLCPVAAGGRLIPGRRTGRRSRTSSPLRRG
jgi:hypothetical protein